MNKVGFKRNRDNTNNESELLTTQLLVLQKTHVPLEKQSRLARARAHIAAEHEHEGFGRTLCMHAGSSASNSHAHV